MVNHVDCPIGCCSMKFLNMKIVNQSKFNFFYENEKGKNDYTTKTMDISRHFTFKKDMRWKIVNFNPENKIPQQKLT